MHNTGNPLPSKDILDLYDNSETIDNFVNSQQDETPDRFGTKRLTLAGLIKRSMALRNEINDFSGALTFRPEWSDVPMNVSEGVGGEGGALNLQAEALGNRINFLDNLIFQSDTIHINKLKVDLTVDQRDYFYSIDKRIFVPLGVVIKCNFKPDDDIRKFIGLGKIISVDQWGHTHTFDLELAANGPKLTPNQLIGKTGLSLSTFPISIGVLGDSITDGAFGGAFTSPNPTDENGNLSSTNYVHGVTEATGHDGWFMRMVNNLIGLIGHSPDHLRSYFKPFNAASSGKGIESGWCYRNFDFGFFKNSGYENKAPDILIISMGTNDVLSIRTPEKQDEYLDKIDSLLYKANGYGSSVAFLITTYWRSLAPAFYESVIKRLDKKYPKLLIIDAADKLMDFSNNVTGDYSKLWEKVPEIGGGFDNIHPSKLGHKYIAAIAARDFYPSRITKVKDGSKVFASQCGSVQAFTPLYDEIIPFGLSVSDNWFGSEKGWPIYQTTTGVDRGLDLTIRHYIWADDSLDLTVVEPKNNFFGNNNLRVSQCTVMPGGYKESESFNCVLSSSGKNDKSFYVTFIGRLERGLNIVDITYFGVINAYAPILSFSKPSNNARSFGNMEMNVPGKSSFILGQNKGITTIFEDSFIGLGPGDTLPNRGINWVGTIFVKHMSPDTFIKCWADEFIGDGTGVRFVSSTAVEICSISSGFNTSTVKVINGDFSGDFVIQFYQLGNGVGGVQVTDTKGIKTHHGLSNMFGGKIGVGNSAVSPSRVSIINASFNVTPKEIII